MNGPDVLVLREGRVQYGKALAVRDASLHVAAGSITALVGPNGARKSSLVQAALGIIPNEAAAIELHGRSILNLSATARVKAGLVLVPQGRQLFPHLSVRDNLLVIANAFRIRPDAVELALEQFPILREREEAPAGVLSGGEQQMLALASAVMCDPKVLILDEPMLGLAPAIVKDVIEVLLRMREQGKSILIAEPTTRALPRQLDLGFMIIRGTRRRSRSANKLKRGKDGRTCWQMIRQVRLRRIVTR